MKVPCFHKVKIAQTLTLTILLLSEKSITATKYIFDCLVHFLQYHNSIRISPVRFTNQIETLQAL